MLIVIMIPSIAALMLAGYTLYELRLDKSDRRAAEQSAEFEMYARDPDSHPYLPVADTMTDMPAVPRARPYTLPRPVLGAYHGRHGGKQLPGW